MADKSIRKKLMEAKADMANPIKDMTADAGRYSYSYAGLPQYHAIVKPALAAHGLDFSQGVKRYGKDDYTLVLTVTDGSEELVLDERPWVHRMDSQALGSAETYDLRYQLRTAFNLPAEDDDGRKAKEYEAASSMEAVPQMDRVRSGISAVAKKEGVSEGKVKTGVERELGCTVEGASPDELGRMIAILADTYNGNFKLIEEE